jgi:3-oxoacyl-[acyl-carrier protein] reductase
MTASEATSSSCRRHDGKSVLVTGASRGIGREIALRFAAEGANVAIGFHSNSAEAEMVLHRVRDQNVRAVAIEADLARSDGPARLVEATVGAFGGIDILVNNAAVFPWTNWSTITTDEWDRVFAVNVRAAFLCAQSAAPHMIRAGWGRIISIGSATFFSGSATLMHYAASKGAVVGLTRSLARALGDHGITVNAVSTGRTLSDGVQDWIDKGIMNMDEAVASRGSQSIKRLGQPDDIAGTVSFLASNDSSYMTGQLLNVDGGRNMQ